MDCCVKNTCELEDADFEKISRFVYSLCGINLHEGKRELVKARLGKRLKKGNFVSFSDYLHFVMTDEGSDELTAMINSLSTNLTGFFREESHFQKLRGIIFEEFSMPEHSNEKVKLRIWSAGCSTGEEPYTIAMVLAEALEGRKADMKILATDISTSVLKRAAAGIYSEKSVSAIPPVMRFKFFLQDKGRWSGQYKIKENLRVLVHFAYLNLKECTLPSDSFNIIFCRNVMIYFDKNTQHALITTFYNLLKPGGYLFVGHSESLTGFAHPFRYVEPSVYRK
ncbi:MAG: protein-glutamate O-methyltransferase [Syntrophales bacterium]|jgi:chemotaxis protein methyltransferase CheR|nr:protein-glutamate O-methyltransferase [Syntrophales bacterium]